VNQDFMNANAEMLIIENGALAALRPAITHPHHACSRRAQAITARHIKTDEFYAGARRPHSNAGALSGNARGTFCAGGYRDVGLEHSNSARDQQYDDTQRNENLHYSE
jgi:hypothetical protein